MPTYDYVCQACDHAFELVQSMRDPVKLACPACKKRKLKRLIGTGMAILIGGKGTPEPASSSTKPADPAPSKTTNTTNESPKEKTLSGSTSTPTHEAREGRGIGNLKDAAKRTRQENAKKTTPPASSGPKSTSTSTSKAKTSTQPKKTPVKRSATQPKPKNSGRTSKRA